MGLLFDFGVEKENNGDMRFPSPHAIKLQIALENRGIKTIAEFPDGYKHVDIFLPEANINIEVDGIEHLTNAEKILADFDREHFSDIKNIRTLHISNTDLDNYLEKISDSIAEVVKRRKN